VDCNARANNSLATLLLVVSRNLAGEQMSQPYPEHSWAEVRARYRAELKQIEQGEAAWASLNLPEKFVMVMRLLYVAFF
jgi:hypothetical protein